MNSKNKGNSFERKISKLLSTRFQAHTGITTSFRRNIDSGSFFGGNNKARVQTHDTSKATFGDIVCPDDFHFTLECKHYKEPPSFASIVKQEYALFDGWIKQGKIDAESAGKDFLLIVKFNNVPEIVFTTAPANIRHVFEYKGMYGYTLEDFLAQDDSYFFSRPVI